MGKRKGLSVEEKREKMQELLHETKDVYTMKQLEKDCSKKKNIVSQTVKEIAQGLVSDDLIQSDKIGIGVFYWSFPSQSLIVRENKMKVLDQQIEELRRKITETESSIEDATVGKEETEERVEALKTQAELQEENGKLKATCSKFASLDPDFLDQQREDVNVAFNAANRWTDNIFALKSHCTKVLSLPDSQFDQYFEIPESFDYIELKGK